MSIPQLIEFSEFGDNHIGYLSFAEQNIQLPFDLKRAYWIYQAPNKVARGGHAHIGDELVIICVQGSVVVKTINQQSESLIFTLDKPFEGLYIPKMHWRELEMGNQSILLCLSSTHYNENDYIKDFKSFLDFRL